MAKYGGRVDENWKLEGCLIGRGTWRNFLGEKTRFNNKGEYGFTVFLPESLFHDMEEAGWYVKHKEQYAGDPREFQLDVSFTFDKYPPNITMISSDGKTAIITEENVALLQNADFESCDIVIRPHNWTNEDKGDSGVKAFLSEMEVRLRKPYHSRRASFDEDAYEE